MKRHLAIIITIIIVVVGAIIAVILWTQQPQQSTSTPQTTDTSSNGSLQNAGEVTVRMQNTKFNPASITIKKGTKVTWVNEDSIRHNVVATDSDNTGGLPTQNDLFGKGGSYSFTFETSGTFRYHCTPHPFMTGTIVVE